MNESDPPPAVWVPCLPRDVEARAFLDECARKPNVLEQCTGEGLLERLNSMRAQVEMCAKALAGWGEKLSKSDFHWLFGHFLQ